MKTILVMAASGYVFKVLYEALATPLTYAIVGFLQAQRGRRRADEGTDFQPLREGFLDPPRRHRAKACSRR
ncbi:MAG: VUT family protein [Holophagaceae bacterium]|nr:VUT family protein [Holophagaceae bacterium]